MGRTRKRFPDFTPDPSLALVHRVGGPEKQQLHATSGGLARPKASRQHPGIIEDEHVARKENIREIREHRVTITTLGRQVHEPT
jgi:hypothetical protein